MVTPKTFHVKPMQQCILTVETPLCHAEVFLIKQWQLIQIIAYLSSLFRIRAIRVVKQIQYFFTVIRSCQDHTYLLVFHWIDNQVVLIQERITSIIFRVHDGADMIFSIARSVQISVVEDSAMVKWVALVGSWSSDKSQV